MCLGQALEFVCKAAGLGRTTLEHVEVRLGVPALGAGEHKHRAVRRPPPGPHLACRMTDGVFELPVVGPEDEQQ
jgi:hypothetical protein